MILKERRQNLETEIDTDIQFLMALLKGRGNSWAARFEPFTEAIGMPGRTGRSYVDNSLIVPRGLSGHSELC